MLRETTALPAPGARLAFNATAYCKGVTTTSGVAAQTGVAAADPQLLPVGSVVEIDSIEPRYNGIYTIMDTGPSMQGRQVDIYMWSCDEALRFGRRPIRLVVLRLGWNPASDDARLHRSNVHAAGTGTACRARAGADLAERSSAGSR